MFFFYLFAGLLGISFGSFMSVIVSRLDEEGSVVSGRSRCPKCSAGLRWYDLIPIVSFLLLRGRCRYCMEKISYTYPLMEAVVAGSFILYIWARSPIVPGPEDIYYFVLIFILLALAFFDQRYYILPDKFVFTGVGVAFFYQILFVTPMFLSNLWTGLGLAGFFAIIYVMSHGEWMGFGDVKLAFLVGLVLGYPGAVFSIIAAVWAGAIWGIVMIFLSKASLRTALPFGSFISGIAVLFIIFSQYVEILLQKI